MRHSNAGKKFSRTPSHRKALLRNLAKALLSRGKIRTTETKAKALRGIVEPLITLALRNDLHARRRAYRVLGSHSLVKRLFDEIAPVFAGVPGGYTRVVKLARPRRGDNAPLALIELTRGPDDAHAPVTPAKPAKPARTADAPATTPQAPQPASPPAEDGPEEAQADAPQPASPPQAAQPESPPAEDEPEEAQADAPTERSGA